ncbi:MAG: serine/threonine protein kinase [Cytophagaceae bacterium]|nr:serine/threonine protein kinase [Cytophagaceae bacterium]
MRHVIVSQIKKAGTKDYAIMQYYPDGNLHQLLKNSIKLSLEQKKEIIKGILEGLQYLHQEKRIHRDFKPSNILIAKTPKGAFVPLIADFGLTKVVKEKDYIDGSDIELSDSRGTLSYKAPEQFIGGIAHYNLDLWAFGVILYEMLTGELPFKRGETGSEQTRIAEQQRRIVNVQLPEKLNVIEEPYQTMIRNCLVKDIHGRVRDGKEIIRILNTNQSKKEEEIIEKTDLKGEEDVTSDKKIKFNKLESVLFKIEKPFEKLYLKVIFYFSVPLILGFLHIYFTNEYYFNQSEIKYFDWNFMEYSAISLSLIFMLLFTFPLLILKKLNKNKHKWIIDILESIVGLMILSILIGGVTWLIRFSFLSPYSKDIIQPKIVNDAKINGEYPPLANITYRDLGTEGIYETYTSAVLMLKDMDNPKTGYTEFSINDLNNTICPEGFNIPTQEQMEFWLNGVLNKKIQLNDTMQTFPKIINISPSIKHGFWIYRDEKEKILISGFQSFWIKANDGKYKIFTIGQESYQAPYKSSIFLREANDIFSTAPCRCILIKN